MDLKTLNIPAKFEKMIDVFSSYQKKFNAEMLSIPNSDLLKTVDKYFSILQELSKSPELCDIARASVGLVCIHEFGYNDFPRITRIFDRIIPQTDPEYVKFTSWCAGKLVHHPGVEQSRYVAHLLERFTGWVFAHGRRTRHLAAVCMIEQVALNAGSDVVEFFQQFQSAIWVLVSHPSMHIIEMTAGAITMFTRAMLRYRRSDLTEYLTFFTELCLRLMSFGSPFRVFTSMRLFQVFFKSCPDFYASNFCNLYDQFLDITESSPILVKSEAFVTIAYLSYVDPTQFVKYCAYTDIIDELILEFPDKTIRAVCVLINNLPEYSGNDFKRLLDIEEKVISDPPDEIILLKTMLQQYGDKVLPISEKIIDVCLDSDISTDYIDFFVIYAKTMGGKLPESLVMKLTEKVKNEYKSGNKELALSLISSLPLHAIYDEKSIMRIITENSLFETENVRKLIPAAVLQLAHSTEDSAYIKETRERLFQLALFDPSNDVRCSILSVLSINSKNELAMPEELKYIQLFANDGSTNVRSLVFKIIKELQDINPLYAANITRYTLLEHLSIIRNVPGIILRAKTIRTLPDLIAASSDTMKIYAKPLVEIASDILLHPIDPQQLNNFLEVEANTEITINIINSVALLAPIAPNIIVDDVCKLLPNVCQRLSTHENRDLVLAILHLLFVLMSPPASTIQYRVMAPLILQSCSQFLAKTQSRKCRMATLRVIGAIGVLEVHQRQPPLGSQSPTNIDEQLMRESFLPSRDNDNAADDTLLIKPQTHEQCYTNIVATSLLKILSDEKCKDLHEETANALCRVLSNPKMYMLSFFDSFFTKLLELLEQGSSQEYITYLPVLSTLISNSTHNSTPFISRTLQFIVKSFDEKYATYFLDVIIAFCKTLRDAFAKYASSIIQILVSCLESNKSVNATVCEKVFLIFTNVGIYAEDLLYLIIPQVCDVVSSGTTLVDIRVSALHNISILGEQVQLYMYLGPIVRAMNYGIGSKYQSIVQETFRLLFSLLKTQGSLFLKNSMPLISYIRRSGLSTDELEKAIANAEAMEYFTPIITAIPPPKPAKPIVHAFSEETIISHAAAPLLGPGKHIDQWLHEFIIACISNSPSDTIRTCTTLASSYHPLMRSLFMIAFFSCLQKMSEEGRKKISHSFYELLVASDGYDLVVKDIMELVFFISKYDSWVHIPTKELIKAAIKHGSNAFALCLQENFIKRGNTSESVLELIDIYTKLGDWVEAVGVWNVYSPKVPSINKIDILVKLKMWDNVLPSYQQKFERQKDINSFKGLIKADSHLGNWEDVIQQIDHYSTLSRSDKRELTSYFGNAAYTLGKWDKLDEVLESKADDSVRGMVLQALNEIRKGNYDIDQIITNAWSVLASRPITFWGDNNQIHKDTMLTAQQIVEVLEIKDWVSKESLRPEIEKVWRQRLQTAPRDFESWFKMISNREKITHVRDNIYIELFQLKSKSLGSKMNTKAFNSLFPDFDFNKSPDLDRICYVVNHWNNGEKKLAIKEMKILTETVEGELLDECHNFYSTWIREMSDSTETMFEAYEHLKKVPAISYLINEVKNRDYRKGPSSPSLRRYSNSNTGLVLPTSIVNSMEIDATDIDALRKWSDVNSELISIDPLRLTKYVTNAITALTKCCIISPSFTDVVQLFNLFFEYAEQGDVFEQSSHCILKVPVNLLLHAAPQLLVQLSHSSQKVAKFVHDLMFKLLDVHYHALIFSLIVGTFSNNSERAAASKRLNEEFCAAHPEESIEVNLIRKTLLRAAVTWYEKCLSRIVDARDFFGLNRINDMVNSLRSIEKMVSHPKCKLQEEFLREYKDPVNELRSLLAAFSPNSQLSLNGAVVWCKKMQYALEEKIKKIKFIKLSTLSEELDAKTHFKLAVPGTYKVGKPIVRIQYFVGQFSVYSSKQQPKDVILRGEDGNFYQYLVKGHEDLRLDERIMQLFHLINTFLRKETVFGGAGIGTISAIPLSIQHGLVSWVSGTITLRALVENYRTLYGRMTNEEFVILENDYPLADMMMPIRKQQIFEKICQRVPSTDIANYIKIKANTAEIWLKQTRMFAKSTAMTSIVGYIIGLGDRHPSNLLIDRLTGKVVHIDFGDCFERAAKRKFLPEVVPFRLTRMMVSAMGVTGTNGAFYSTFVNTARVLRENRRVLVMVLSIFIYEPLVEPDEFENGGSSEKRGKSIVDASICGSVMERGRVMFADNQKQSSIEMRNRINQKLCGKDFENTIPLTVEEQANLLIMSATNPYNLAKMYSGWCSFW